MGLQRILIVDDEESVLTILKNSLKGMKSQYEIVTATDGQTAFQHLKEDPFDLVVTDYKMAGMDGLELLESVRSIQPDTRVILMTAYGSDTVEAEARRLQAYRFLTKPLHIDAFRQVVKEAVGDMAISRPGILILSDERYRQVVDQLNALQDDVGAHCIILSDTSGNVIAKLGNPSDLPVEQIASLMGGGIATLIESGRALDDREDSINFAYRDGLEDCLYAINVGEQLLIILMIHKKEYTSRIGSVWHYAQRTVLAMRQTIGDAEYASPQQVFNEMAVEDIQKELDDLLLNEPATDEIVELVSSEKNKDEIVAAKPNESSAVITYEEALNAGVISSDLTEENGVG